MSATDELRRMLDERGVEYKTKDRPSADHADWEAWMHGDGHQPSGAVRRETLWGQPTDVASGKSIPHVYHYRATEMGDRLFLEAQLVTPEQAIAATLGHGTCTLPETRVDHGSIEYNGVTEWRKCSACGEEVLAYPTHFCPNCGRKVVDE